MSNLPLNIQKLTWQEVRKDVHKVNPELAAIIDEIDPGPEFPLYRARYVYGNLIINMGQLHLPLLNGKVIPISSSQIPKELVNDLNMFEKSQDIIGMPPGILLNNSIEIFYHNKQFVPATVYKPGAIFGLWRTTAKSRDINWHMFRIGNVSAGCRSLMMLPKITDTAGHKRLRKEFNLHVHQLGIPLNQWALFSELAVHPEFPEPWAVDVLFMTRPWLEHMKEKAWQDLWYSLILEKWQQTDFWRNQRLFDHFISYLQHVCNLKPDPYLADTAAYLFTIGAGENLGFVIANDNSIGPVRSLQKIFQEVYGLKSHAPIMIHADAFDVEKPNSTAYYSLQLPTTSKFSPKLRQATSNMANLKEIKYMMEKFYCEILSTNLLAEGDKLYHLVKNMKLNYFHCENDPLGDIEPSSLLITRDLRLASEMNRFPHNTFPDSASFWHGCIGLSSVGN